MPYLCLCTEYSEPQQIMVFLLSPSHFFLSSSFSPSLKRRRICFKPARTTRRSGPAVRAALITSSDSFEVGRLIGSYGFINVTSYSGLQPEIDFGKSFGEVGQLKVQDVGEGSVKIRLYEGRVTQGPLKGTPITFKVYPGQRAAGREADMMAANELGAHSFLQSSSKGICPHLVQLVGGFETNTGEQWLAFRNDGNYSAADYAKITSEKVSRNSGMSWNSFEVEQSVKRRRHFVIRLLRGAMKGLAYMHDHDRLHQSLGPSSVVLNTIVESDAAYLIPRLRDLAFSVDIRYSYLEDGPDALSEGLWKRALSAGAYTTMEKRAFGVADDIYEAGFLLAYLAFVPFCDAGLMDGLSLQRLLESTFRLDVEAAREYCLADERLVDAVNFLDIGDGAGWELLQAMLNPEFRKRPTAEAVLNHRFLVL